VTVTQQVPQISRFPNFHIYVYLSLSPKSLLLHFRNKVMVQPLFHKIWCNCNFNFYPFKILISQGINSRCNECPLVNESLFLSSSVSCAILAHSLPFCQFFILFFSQF